MAQAVQATVRLRGEAPGGPGQPRRESAQHIDDTLRRNGAYGEPTVGRDVSEAIKGIRAVAGEGGSHSVQKAFIDPRLTEAYLTKTSDRPAARAAHRMVAGGETQYWEPEHSQRPSAGTRAATSVHLDTRVRLQEFVGAATGIAESAHRHSAGEQDQFFGHGGAASALPPAPTHTQRPPTEAEITAYWAAQQRSQQQQRSQRR
ncbi:hypothetical protein ACIOKD_02575 [Streptomyces sp. NPDC087844]|uniref:hypothetical protein n=1 Tax=Streptomyces sp. NPDC087844 TaxID=3365805 RepID=UPI0037F9DD79